MLFRKSKKYITITTQITLLFPLPIYFSLLDKIHLETMNTKVTVLALLGAIFIASAEKSKQIHGIHKSTGLPSNPELASAPAFAAGNLPNDASPECKAASDALSKYAVETCDLEIKTLKEDAITNFVKNKLCTDKCDKDLIVKVEAARKACNQSEDDVKPLLKMLQNEREAQCFKVADTYCFVDAASRWNAFTERYDKENGAGKALKLDDLSTVKYSKEMLCSPCTVQMSMKSAEKGKQIVSVATGDDKKKAEKALERQTKFIGICPAGMKTASSNKYSSATSTTSSVLVIASALLATMMF